MDTAANRPATGLARLVRTGYPPPINIFAGVMLTLLPVLSLLSGEGAEQARPALNHGLAIGLSLAYLVVWLRVPALDPKLATGLKQEAYLLLQAAVVSLIYAFDQGLTHFLYVVVAVQAVYLIPVRRWAPFVGTVAALWLTLYLAIAPTQSGSSLVATVGMYFLYLLFAALVTFTAVQQERQRRLAQELLQEVDQRHGALRALDQTVEQRSQTEERERLAVTIHGTLLSGLAELRDGLDTLLRAPETLSPAAARTARLQAKAVLGSVRRAVKTLRPGVEGNLDEDLAEEDASPHFDAPPAPDITLRATDPIKVYHVWNLGVIVVTTGLMIATTLLAGASSWPPVLLLGGGLLLSYGGAALARWAWWWGLWLAVQAGIVVAMVWLTREPYMNHLFLIIAAQMVLRVPLQIRWLVASILVPTSLSGLALYLTSSAALNGSGGGGGGGGGLPISLTLAFGVTYFFAGVMAFMTRRQVEARERAILYARQIAEVNRLLESRLQEARRLAVARERVRMAREIHDGMGHHLTAVIVELQYAEALAGEDPQAAAAHVASAHEVLGAAMAAGQEMGRTLERFDRPLPEALQELVAAWQGRSDARITLEMTGAGPPLTTACRITLYRAVQESLTNIQKHARARTVAITLQQLRDRVCLTVVNDDTGQGPRIDAGPGGFGLVHLRERAEALQGEFAAGPRPEGGFRVSLILPAGA